MAPCTKGGIFLSLCLLVFVQFGETIANNSSVKCGGRIMRANGYILSPRYPNAYPANQDCTWIITASRGYEISFAFLDFQLEGHPKCLNDWVKIYDGSSVMAPRLGHYCGNQLPVPVRSRGSSLYIHFSSDDVTELKGFKAMYNSSLVCGGTYEGLHGSLTSPNYPNNYYINSDCVYKIVAPVGYTIKATFVDFALEPASGRQPVGRCFDYVQVFDGDTVMAPSLGKFCGSLARFHLVSTGNVMLVRLISDRSVNSKGFKLAYSAIAPPTTTPPPATTEAPLNCLSNQFRCNNGKCIDYRWRCDKQDDCGDMSDELWCPCKPNQLRCDNGRCEDKRWWCDGQDDCNDGSDEKNCSASANPTPTNAQGCKLNNGGCAHICAERTIRGHVITKCQCRAGYHLHSDNKQCIDDDECSNPNRCDHVCINNPGSYACACHKGFFLKLDERSCADLDECFLLNNGGCSQLCLNTQGSYRCACDYGYRLLSDGKTCQDIDECAINKGGCSHTCQNTAGGYQCQCPRGYIMQQDNKTCEDINECETSNGGCEHRCVNDKGGFRCECYAGYMQDVMMPSRCMDIDECMEGIPECFNCINLRGSYRCECGQGFVPNANQTHCSDVNECEVQNGGCGKHTCINTYGSYKCQCLDGYRLDARTEQCVDIDECARNHGKGDCEHLCTNTVGSFSCSCHQGYRLKGKHQCVDVDECSDNSLNRCQQTCNNSIGSFKCTCRPGYHLAIDGFSCTKEKAPPGCGIALEADLANLAATPGWQPAHANSWPWTALLHFGGFLDIEGCMGTLVDQEWIMTTAHCLHVGAYQLQPQFIKVELGVHKRGQGKSSPKLLDVKRVEVHSSFKADLGKLTSNIALVQLAHPLNFTDDIHAICLPTRKETEVLRGGSSGVVIGWGKTTNKTVYTDLRQANVTLVHRHRCSWALRNYDGNRLLCAGFLTSDVTCISDSGSPLMFPVPHAQNPNVKRWILGGILSWGLNTLTPGCHSDYSHSAYVDIGSYLKWIRSIVKPKKGN